MSDPGVAGRINVATFEAILRAFGFCLSRLEIRIFDGGNKGHITLDDKRQVQRKVREAKRELHLGGVDSITAIGSNTALRATIERFNLNALISMVMGGLTRKNLQTSCS